MFGACVFGLVCVKPESTPSTLPAKMVERLCAVYEFGVTIS